MPRDDPDFIESVDKAMSLLQAFSSDEPTLRVSRAAELVGISRAAARRLLLTFERLGFVESDNGAFRLTSRVLRIGYGYLSALPLWDHAQSRLRELADSLNESCSIATLDGSDIVYVARVAAKRSMSLTLTIGSRLPAYPTSMGRVLLASLPAEALEKYLAHTKIERLTPHTVADVDQLRQVLEHVRRVGYALVDGEREEGVRSAATSIRGLHGETLAAINVSVNAARVSLEELEKRLVPELMIAAADISENVKPVVEARGIS